MNFEALGEVCSLGQLNLEDTLVREHRVTRPRKPRSRALPSVL